MIMGSFPNKVFKSEWSFWQIYKYDFVFHAGHEMDIFFDSLDQFVLERGQVEYYVRSLGPLLGEYINEHFEKVMKVGEPGDFTFASWLDEFYFSDIMEDWGVYCNRGFEIVIFGMGPTAKAAYHRYFDSLSMSGLKYKNVDLAVDAIKPFLSETEGADFISQFRKSYS